MTDLPLPLVPPTKSLPAEVQAELAELLEAGHALRAQRHAADTRKAYLSDSPHLADGCTYRSITSLPAGPGAVWLFLTALVEADNAAGYKAAALERRMSAIKWVHETNGHPSPAAHTEIHQLMARIRRRFKLRPDKVEPLTLDQTRAMIITLDLGGLTGQRDRALLLAGYAGGFRRYELASFQRPQLRRITDDYVTELLGSEDDQKGDGRRVGIAAFPSSQLCPVAAVDVWPVAAAITDGPFFRKVTRDQTPDRALTDADIAHVVIRTATAGIPSDCLSCHSLRAGTRPLPSSTTSPTGPSCSRLAMNTPGSWTATSTRHGLHRQLRHLPWPQRQRHSVVTTHGRL